MPSQQLTEELREILRTEYGVGLTMKETSEVARKLTDAFDVLLEINFKDDPKNTNKANKQIELLHSNATINKKA